MKTRALFVIVLVASSCTETQKAAGEADCRPYCDRLTSCVGGGEEAQAKCLSGCVGKVASDDPGLACAGSCAGFLTCSGFAEDSDVVACARAAGCTSDAELAAAGIDRSKATALCIGAARLLDSADPERRCLQRARTCDEIKRCGTASGGGARPDAGPAPTADAGRPSADAGLPHATDAGTPSATDAGAPADCLPLDPAEHPAAEGDPCAFDTDPFPVCTPDGTALVICDGEPPATTFRLLCSCARCGAVVFNPNLCMNEAGIQVSELNDCELLAPHDPPFCPAP